MINIFATSDRRFKRWLLRAFALLIVLAVGMQVAHVHAAKDFSGSVCVACVSAHSSVPVAAIVLPAFLVAATFAFIVGESEPPTHEVLQDYFIRPPPSF